MLNAQRPYDANEVRAWMREYGLFRGINTDDRNLIVESYRSFVGNHQRIGVEHYLGYQSMVRQLQNTHAQLLGALRAQHQEIYPYDVRIMDKLLWMLGNPEGP